MITMSLAARLFGLCCCVGLVALPAREGKAQGADKAAPPLVAQGAYVATAGDCIACHTAPGGKSFAGGLAFDTPIGTIYSTNITPDPKHGIGTWSYEDFARLMRTGMTKNGTTVYPAMPYPSYAHVSDGDMRALYAYFMQGVTPADVLNRDNGIPFPLSMRWPLKIWGWAFAPGADAAAKTTSDLAQNQPATVARGAYLVEGLGHCGACHTARGLAFQERALSAADGPAYLAGAAAIDGWVVPSLRGDPAGGLGSWSEDDIVSFLKNGRNARTATFGSMSDVVVHSMQFLSDTDLHSIAAYLKSLPAASAKAATYQYDEKTALALQAGDTSTRGAQVYIDRCAACHRTDGHGYNAVFPALAGNSILQGDNGTSAMHIVLSGGRLPATKTAPSSFVMAPYAKVLTDREIADVVSFIQTSWGNNGKPVSPAEVASMRK